MKISNTTLPLPCTPKTFMECLKAAKGRAYDVSFIETAEYITAVVNLAYLDGLNGRDGYPEDPERELADWTSECGVELTEGRRRMVRLITRWRNEAYQEGRRAREEARG